MNLTIITKTTIILFLDVAMSNLISANKDSGPRSDIVSENKASSSSSGLHHSHCLHDCDEDDCDEEDHGHKEPEDCFANIIREYDINATDNVTSDISNVDVLYIDAVRLASEYREIIDRYIVDCALIRELADANCEEDIVRKILLQLDFDRIEH